MFDISKCSLNYIPIGVFLLKSHKCLPTDFAIFKQVFKERIATILRKCLIYILPLWKCYKESRFVDKKCHISMTSPTPLNAARIVLMHFFLKNLKLTIFEITDFHII